MKAKQSRRSNDDYSIIKHYHIAPRTSEAIRRLSFENGITEGQVIDKIVRTHLATQELGALLEAKECQNGT